MSQAPTTHSSPDSTTTNAAQVTMNHQHLKQRYEAAASWNNVPLSASCLAGVNLAFFLYWSLGLTFVSLLLYSSALLVCFGYPYTKFTAGGKNMASQKDLEVFPRQNIEKLVTRAYDQLNSLASEGRAILCWSSFQRSAIALNVLVFAAWLSSRLSPLLMCYLGANFALLQKPAGTVYKKYAAPILEPYIKTGRETLKSVIDKIPKLNEAAIGERKKI